MNTLREVLSNVKKVERSEVLGPCWEWQGAKFKTGYGAVRWRGSAVLVHRLVGMVFVSCCELPMVFRHMCDNRLCCNPLHLTTGTKGDNIRDRFERGFTRTQVIYDHDAEEIRERHERGETLDKLAARYGVCKTTISYCVRGVTHQSAGGKTRRSRREE